MGKYIRHAIAVLASAIVGTLLAAFGVQPELLSPEVAEAVGQFTAALETAIWLFMTLVVYPVVEKFLKRFAVIDFEGWTDRLRLKREAGTDL